MLKSMSSGHLMVVQQMLVTSILYYDEYTDGELLVFYITMST
jgi:hypothetical protein